MLHKVHGAAVAAVVVAVAVVDNQALLEVLLNLENRPKVVVRRTGTARAVNFLSKGVQ